MLKKENGITLVALVITIIVLLILAGITLALVLGDNGLFGKAKTSSVAMEAATAKEKVQLAIIEVQADIIDGTSSKPADVDGYKNLIQAKKIFFAIIIK